MFSSSLIDLLLFPAVFCGGDTSLLLLERVFLEGGLLEGGLLEGGLPEGELLGEGDAVLVAK